MSLNSNEAQVLQKQGSEWRTVETLAEVRSSISFNYPMPMQAHLARLHSTTK